MPCGVILRGEPKAPSSRSAGRRQPFRSFADFIRFREPFGLGMHTEVVDAILREQDGTKTLAEVMAQVEPLAKNGGDRKRGHQLAVSRMKYSSTGSAYLLARIKRDAPEARRAGHSGADRRVPERAGCGHRGGNPVQGNASLEAGAKRVLAKGEAHARAVVDAIVAALLEEMQPSRLANRVREMEQ